MAPRSLPRASGSAARQIPAILLAALWLVATPVLGQTRLYLAEYQYNNPRLKTMLLDGSSVQEIFTPPLSEWLLVGLDYDATAGKIYWTHGSHPGTIRRANPDGSAGQLLLTGLKYPRGVALDPLAGKIYWAEAPPQGNAMGLIRRSNADGTGLETWYALAPYDPNLSYVGKPIVDPLNGYLYFCAANEIRRVKLEGPGPAQTVVRGLNTTTAVALDIANDKIYFVDGNTNTDILGCARLDDTDFEVLVDLSPGAFGSSGLYDLRLDLAGGKAYFTDEIAKVVRRCNLDGSGLEVIYTSPASLAPTSISFDADPLPPVQDCNGNSIRDLDDIESGTSEDCNGNGIPDECEANACEAVTYGIDYGSDPGPTGRVLSGDPSTGFEVFQSFEFVTLPEVPGLSLVEIMLDGWNVNYHPAGFRATLFPDNGSGFADETRPLASADFRFRFSPNTVVWVGGRMTAFLPAGRYWVRLSANDPAYYASVNVGLSGPPSISRRLSSGELVPSTYSIALRVRFADPAGVSAPPEGRRVDLSVRPNPARGPIEIECHLDRSGEVAIAIHDPAGRLVRRWQEGWRSAGAFLARWDGRDAESRVVPAGAYIVSVETQGAGARSEGARKAIHRQFVVLR